MPTIVVAPELFKNQNSTKNLLDYECPKEFLFNFDKVVDAILLTEEVAEVFYFYFARSFYGFFLQLIFFLSLFLYFNTQFFFLRFLNQGLHHRWKSIKMTFVRYWIIFLQR